MVLSEGGLSAQRGPWTFAAVHCGREKRGRRQPCEVTTSDVLRGNRSYFLWITLPFISLQINLVIVADKPSSYCQAVLCGFHGVCTWEPVSTLPLCHLIAFGVLSSVNATCCGCETTGHEDCQGPVGPQLGPSPCTSSRAEGPRFSRSLN